MKYRIENDANSFFPVFLEYLESVHIKLEEDILVPALKDEFDSTDKKFVMNMERIMADHKLLGKLGENIVKWIEGGDSEMIAQRVPLFVRLLLDHNSSEEVSVFPSWKSMDARMIKATLAEARNMITDFGVVNYSMITGVSDRFLEYLFD
ncbi:MAG: hypothetical protein M1375_04765 [Candidatus Thermoplasmatota archaeon]|nr:hypothetical protein [Candidatus Thermoplasmatota archaeon]MCL5791264.1 hypothetical protein [Candidatus Thermoplasmatota archaeon]